MSIKTGTERYSHERYGIGRITNTRGVNVLLELDNLYEGVVRSVWVNKINLGSAIKRNGRPR